MIGGTKTPIVYCLSVPTYMDANGDGIGEPRYGTLGDFVEFARGCKQRPCRMGGQAPILGVGAPGLDFETWEQ